jgi:hypothetical protein
VLETALNQEMTEHLGHDKHGPVGNETGNVRNGTRPKTVLTEASGRVGIEVPRDRHGTFEPQFFLFIPLAGPRRSGSTGPSRLAQGCSRPNTRLGPAWQAAANPGR